MSGLKNNFSKKTKELFRELYFCTLCGNDYAHDLHHILKRVSRSPFNAAPLCRRCHDNIVFDDETVRKLLYSSMMWLSISGYVITKKDEEFMEQFKTHYEALFTELYEGTNKYHPAWAKKSN